MAGLGGFGQSSESDITDKESDRIFHCQTQQAGFKLPIQFPFQISILFQYSNLENLLV